MKWLTLALIPAVIYLIGVLAVSVDAWDLKDLGYLSTARRTYRRRWKWRRSFITALVKPHAELTADTQSEGEQE
jgi:hypothetical protein